MPDLECTRTGAHTTHVFSLPCPSRRADRLAQRAFRQRQKAYFVDLEAEVVEKSSQIQVITKNNQSLMEMMERLQRENIAVSHSLPEHSS